VRTPSALLLLVAEEQLRGVDTLFLIGRFLGSRTTEHLRRKLRWGAARFAPTDGAALSPSGSCGELNCAVLAHYIDLRRTLDRVRIAELDLHSISLNLTTPLGSRLM
jgi:hypothetical protein